MANYSDLKKKAALYKAAKQESGATSYQNESLADKLKRIKEKAQQPNVVITPKMNDYSYGRWQQDIESLNKRLEESGYDPKYLEDANRLMRSAQDAQHYLTSNADRYENFDLAQQNHNIYTSALDEIDQYLKLNNIVYPRGIPKPIDNIALDAGQQQFLNTLTDPNEKLEYLMSVDPARADAMLENMEQRSKNWAEIYRKQLEEITPSHTPYLRYGEGAATTASDSEASKRNAEIRSLQNRLAEAESDYEALSNREWYAEMQKYPAIVFDRARKQGNTEQADIAWNYLSATDPTRAMQMAEEILAEMTRERQDLVDLYNADPFSFSDESDQRWAYLDEEITKWNELLHKATYQMEGVRMGDVARADSESYDPRFAEFSQYNSIGEYLEPEQMNVAGRIYEYINNDDTAYRMRLAAEADTLTGIPYAADFEKYQLMNDEEIALFNYYYVNDPEQALHYLDTISETLNYRAAVEDYKENWKGKPWKEALLGAWQSGFNQYLAGSESVGYMIAGDNYIPTTKGEYLAGMMREDLSDSKFATGVYDVGSSIANMLPSVLVSSVSPVAGKIVFGASVSGNAYKEAVNKGFDPKAARWYAGAIGAAEVFLQDALGGISKMSGANNLTDKVVNGLLSKVDNAIGRAAIQLGASSMGEATEEYLQEIIGPVLENVILGVHNDINLISEEAIYAGILGAFTALPMNIASPGTEGFIGNIGTAMRENLVATVNKPYASEVVAEAKTYNAGSETLKRVEKQMAKGGTENISNRDLALLVQENAEVAKKDERPTFQPKPKETGKKPSRTIPVNKNGTATTDAGESVAVRGVGYVDGNVLVRVADENGAERNVSRSTLDLSDDVADLVDLAAQYGYAAPAVYAAFDNSMDFDHYADDVEMIMSMAKGSVGVNGTKALNWLKNNQTIKMEPEAIETLFAAGREIGIKEQPLIRRGTGKVTFAEGIDRTQLKGRQKAQVEFLEEFAKLVGVDIEFFESSVENGQYVGENGSYIDNRIRIDLNAGRNYESDSMAKIAITRTASHELTHWLKDIAPKEYQLLRDFVIEKMIDEGGGTLQSLIETKQRRAKGDLSVDDALDEIVADGADLMLGKSQYLREYAQRNAKGYETIKEWLKNFLAKLKKAFEGIGSAHAESRILMQKYADEMISLWDNALKSGLENKATTAEAKADEAKTSSDDNKKAAQPEAEQGGEKMSERERFEEREFSNTLSTAETTISMADIRELQKLGMISVNAFGGKETKMAAKWAYQYKSLKEKNPFFRAWFGDWREFEAKPVEVALIPTYVDSNDARKANRGTQKNKDTEWDIRISREGESNTISHSGTKRKSEYGLAGIKSLVENAILLDTQTHEHHSNNAKNDRIAFDHKLYALGQSNNGKVALYKITVEETFQDPKHQHDMRFHNLKYIKKVADVGSLTQVRKLGAESANDNTATFKYTIADVFAFVKQYDLDFSYNPVSAQMLNTDGTPKKLFHGTDAEFSEFAPGLSGGIYLADNRNVAENFTKSGRILEVYATMKKPLVVDALVESDFFGITSYKQSYYDEIPTPAEMRSAGWSSKTVSTEEISKFAQSRGYDGVIIKNVRESGGDATTDYIVFKSTQIKHATKNMGTFDKTERNMYKSEREYTITDREMLRNLNPASLSGDEGRGYLKNFQQALKEYVDSKNAMRAEEKRLRDPKLSKAQKDEARKKLTQFQRKMEDADKRLINMESMPKVQEIVSKERSYIEKRTTLNDSQIAPEEGRYRPEFEQKITAANEERRKRLTRYYEQVEEFGAIPAGEVPARDVSVPRRTAKDNKVSHTVRTALEAQVTDLDTSLALQEKIQEDGFSYIPISDETAMSVAKQNIAGKTWGEAIADWNKKMAKERIGKYDVAEGFYLYNAAIQNGDTKTAVSILTELTARVREGAQMVQAVRILKKLSPQHKVYALTRSVRELQEQINKQHGENAPKIEMDQNLLDDYLNAKTEEEIDEAKQKLYQSIAQQIPRTFVDKWNAWRYLAMLGNPKTIIRNTLGNALFMPVVEAKNAVGAGLESIFVKDKTQRTKSLAVSGRADLKKAALADYKNVEAAIQGTGKYNDQTSVSDELAEAIRDFKSTFNTWGIRHWQKATNYLMNDSAIGDYGFLRAHYSNAFASACLARGISAADIENGKVSQKKMDSIRAYAIKEAQKATYRDANAFSNIVKKLRFKGDSTAAKVANVFLEGILPFRSTPANVLVRAAEYSPLGLLKTLSVDSFKLKNGDITASEYIDNISSGLTGSMLTAVGWLLGSLGMLITDVDDDDERMGRQPYAIQIGDTSYTLDWLAPEAVPLFLGAAIANAKENDEDVSAFENFFDAMMDMLQPMLELSMLSGVQDLLETMQYGDDGVDVGQIFYAFFVNPAISYASQGVPTILSQFANTLEKTSGFTYTGDIGGKMSKNLVRSVVKIVEKIPFVDIRQADFIDEWGRAEDKGNILQRAFSSFISPGYTSTIAVTDADKELERIEEATGTSVAPSRRGYTITVTDENGVSTKVKLDVNQYEAYSREYGTQAAIMMSALMMSDVYADMSDADRLKALQNINRLADEYGKMAAGVGYEIQVGDSEKKLVDLTMTGLSIGEAYAAKVLHTKLDDDRSIKAGDKAIQFQVWVENQPWNTVQKSAVLDAYGTFWTMVGTDTSRYNEFADTTGLDENAYFALNQAKADKADGYWSQTELKDYLSGTNYSKAQKAAIFDMIFPKAKENPYK